ncbi:hypothetical protein QM334_40670, partial [Burkholderia cenocepacia]
GQRIDAGHRFARADAADGNRFGHAISGNQVGRMCGFGMGRNRNERRPGVEARATTADVRRRSARSA